MLAYGLQKASQSRRGRHLSIAVVLANFWDIFDILKPSSWFREVPEGMEFLAVLLTILGSLTIMVFLGKWWER